MKFYVSMFEVNTWKPNMSWYWDVLSRYDLIDIHSCFSMISYLFFRSSMGRNMVPRWLPVNAVLAKEK